MIVVINCSLSDFETPVGHFRTNQQVAREKPVASLIVYKTRSISLSLSQLTAFLTKCPWTLTNLLLCIGLLQPKSPQVLFSLLLFPS